VVDRENLAADTLGIARGTPWYGRPGTWELAAAILLIALMVWWW
jgi:hypothetical protein